MTALRHPAFRWYVAARFFAMLGVQLQGAAVAWQIYEVTRDPLALGYVGLAQFAPMLALTLVGGQVADAFDRKRILVLTLATFAGCSGALWWLSTGDSMTTWPIYSVLVAVGVARAFVGPAQQAILPQVSAPGTLESALAIASSTYQVAIAVGPSLAGILYATTGRSTVVYASAMGALLFATVSIAMTSTSGAVAPRRGRSVSEVADGLRYVVRDRVLFGAISLDLFAVLFGGAVALLPAVAKDVLHAGPAQFGWLRSAPAIGAVVVGLFLARFPLRRGAGRTMLACVALFGVATLVFGVSTSFWLSLVALFVAGAADMVSVYVRGALIQMRTPPEMLGRVSAVSQVFIGASNELGEFESGLTARWWGVERAIVVGGLGTLAVVAAWTRLFPSLVRADGLSSAAAENSDPAPGPP